MIHTRKSVPLVFSLPSKSAPLVFSLPSKSAPQVFPSPQKAPSGVPPPPGRRENRSKSPYILYIIRCKCQKSRSEKGMFPAHKVAKVVVFLPKLSLCVLPHFCKSSF
nr:MAG TPA: hypothetical protein [Caudoviricetes sp.]